MNKGKCACVTDTCLRVAVGGGLTCWGAEGPREPRGSTFSARKFCESFSLTSHFFKTQHPSAAFRKLDNQISYTCVYSF